MDLLSFDCSFAPLVYLKHSPRTKAQKPPRLRAAEGTANGALWEEIRCRQRGADEEGCGSANGSVRRAAEGRGPSSSGQGAAPSSLHAYCVNLVANQKQLDAASPELSHVPRWVRTARASEQGRKERFEDQVRRSGRAGTARCGAAFRDHPLGRRISPVS